MASSSTFSTSAAFYVFHNVRYLFVICSFLLLHAFWKYTFGVFSSEVILEKSFALREHCAGRHFVRGFRVCIFRWYCCFSSSSPCQFTVFSWRMREPISQNFWHKRRKKNEWISFKTEVVTYVTWRIRQSQVTSTYLHMTFSNLPHNGCYLMGNLICMKEGKQWKSKQHLLHLVGMQMQSTIVWSLKIHVFKLDVFHFIIHLTNSLYFHFRHY